MQHPKNRKSKLSTWFMNAPLVKASVNNNQEAFTNEEKGLLCDNNQDLKPKNNNYSLPTSPCDERVPSRIPFPKKQHKSQTNL